MYRNVPKIYHDISMRIPIMHHYVRICKVCKVLMRRETILHTLDWSREKQHGKQTECSDRIAFTVKGYRKDHQWLRCHKLQRFPKHGWIWLVGWYLFIYTNDQVSFGLLEVSFEHALWKLLAAIWRLIFSSYTFQTMTTTSGVGPRWTKWELVSTLLQRWEPTSVMLRTVWNSSTSCGEDPSRARSLGSRSSATRMVTKKASHDHGSHCNTLNKRGSFPISRIIERKKWPKTLPLEPCPVLEVVCLSELVEQANYPRRIHVTKLNNHSILSGHCLADFANFKLPWKIPSPHKSQKSPCSSISLEQGALLGTAKGPSQPRPCHGNILEHNTVGLSRVSSSGWDPYGSKSGTQQNPLKPLRPCFWFLSKVCKFQISSPFREQMIEQVP